jgi:hypothetical protein
VAPIVDTSNSSASAAIILNSSQKAFPILTTKEQNVEAAHY